jgi:hypothetical protein
MGTPRKIMSDSNNLTYKWLVGILLALVLSLSGGWAVEINTRVTNLEKQSNETTAALVAVKVRQENVIITLGEIKSILESNRSLLERLLTNNNSRSRKDETNP